MADVIITFDDVAAQSIFTGRWYIVNTRYVEDGFFIQNKNGASDGLFTPDPSYLVNDYPGDTIFLKRLDGAMFGVSSIDFAGFFGSSSTAHEFVAIYADGSSIQLNGANVNYRYNTDSATTTYFLPSIFLTGLVSLGWKALGVPALNIFDNIVISKPESNVLRGTATDNIYFVDDIGDAVIEDMGAGVDSVYTSLSNLALPDNVENLIKIGSGNFHGSGNRLSNYIRGDAGNDTLDGGSGADTMSGGSGDDLYIVDDPADLLLENPGQGNDTISTTLSTYVLPYNVENLTFVGTGDFTGTGNTTAGTITGGSGNDTLTGGGGGETLVGGAGNNTYYIGSKLDSVVSTTSGVDTVIEHLSSYVAPTNVKAVVLQATPWNASVSANNLGDDLTALGTSASLLGGTGNDTLHGAAGGDNFDGGLGNDVLYGSTVGAATGDTMRGGAGDDAYYVYNALDKVIELVGNGNDTIDTTLTTFSLTTVYNVENLTFVGAGNFTGTGNSLDNVITGGFGNDTLDGGGSSNGDTLDGGGGGNDTFYVRSSLDVVHAYAGGVNTVYDTIAGAYTMGANVTNLIMTSAFTSNAVGNGLNDTITGSAANNRIDVRPGGLANLTGGGGADTFIFQAGKTNGDVITDFSGAGGQGDKLEFHGYGQSWQGANIAQLDATHWSINSGDGTIHDTIALTNGASVGASDFRFLS